MSTWIFTHGDGDGVCAGALALAANPDANVFFTHPYGLLEDLQQAEEEDTVIICDIALSQLHLKNIIERFSELEQKGSLYYFDHHPLPSGLRPRDLPGIIKHKIGSSASEIVYTFFKDKIGVLQSRVAIYGAISDYMDNTRTIQNLLEMWDKRAIYLDTGILVQSLPLIKREYDLKRSIVRELAVGKPPSLNSKLVDLAVEQSKREEEAIKEIKEKVKIEGEVAYVLDYPFPLGKTAIYARAIGGVHVGIAGETRKNVIDMSLRASGGVIDLNKVLREITPRLGGSGGGHPQAAGARVPKDKFHLLISELNKALRVLQLRN